MFTWLEWLANFLVYDVLKIARGSRAGSAVQFFVFDTVKIFILLTLIVYAITLIRGFFPPERTRRLLAAKKGHRLIGHLLAALLGIVTPFCSCSAVPLFIGFVEAGIPLGVTFTYLVAAPMVNEVALGLLFGLFGWKIALIYVFSGEVIAIASGLIIGRLKMERFIEAIAMTTKVGAAPEGERPSWGSATARGLDFHPRPVEEHLALRGRRHRRRRPDARLDPDRGAGQGGRPRQPVRRADRGGHRHSALQQCRRGHPPGFRADPRRGGHGHGAGLHDGRHRP